LKILNNKYYIVITVKKYVLFNVFKKYYIDTSIIYS
jgi:hypothetical protein